MNRKIFGVGEIMKYSNFKVYRNVSGANCYYNTRKKSFNYDQHVKEDEFFAKRLLNLIGKNIVKYQEAELGGKEAYMVTILNQEGRSYGYDNPKLNETLVKENCNTVMELFEKRNV